LVTWRDYRAKDAVSSAVEYDFSDNESDLAAEESVISARLLDSFSPCFDSSGSKSDLFG